MRHICFNERKEGDYFLIEKQIFNLPTFAADLVPDFKFGIKREVRCNSGAIPVAVSFL
jgi:hypothetical protein